MTGPKSLDDEIDRSADRPRRAGRARLIGLAVAVPCWAMLAVAWWLSPREELAYGTAEQMGRPACSILVRTGYPCPTCGMTTSVSAMAHGKMALAARAHPFGIVLFALAIVFGAAGVVQLATGRDVLGRMRARWWWLLVVLAGVFAGWGWVLYAGVLSGKWPIK